MHVSVRKKKLLLLAVALGVTYWVLESILMCFFFHGRDFLSELTAPTVHELWQRLLVFGFVFGFAFHADSLLAKHQRADDALRASEARHRLLVESSPDAILIQTGEQIVFMNPAGVRLFGAEEPAQLLGRPIWTFALPECQETVREHYRQMTEEGIMVSPVELIFVRLDGTWVNVEMTATPFNFNGKPAIQAIFRDVTQRKQAEAQVRQRNEEMAALNAIAASVSQFHDLDQILNHALDEVLKLDLLGGKAKGMLFIMDQGALKLAVHRGTPEGHPCLKQVPGIGECLCGLVVQRGEMIISDNNWQDQNHTRRWPGMPLHQDICLPLKVRGVVLGVMNVRLPAGQTVRDSDIRLLNSAADQIAVAIENVRLTKARTHAMVEERERIARELHDDLAQLLGYVSTKATAVRLLLKKRKFSAADQQLLQLEEAAQKVLVDVREAILGLRMASEVEKGLPTTLRAYATQFDRLSSLPVEVAIAPQVEILHLGIETELQLFRIVQESLSNIRKHALASRAWIELSTESETLQIVVGDDGAGFDQKSQRAEKQSHFGLVSMCERAAAVGAELTVTSNAGAGTQVIVRMPLKENQKKCVS